MIILTLPFPPSMNTYWRNFRGRTVLSKKGREYKLAIQDYVVTNKVAKLGDARLKVTMVLMPRDKRKIDIDNRIKSVLDGLQDSGVFDDDWQIDELSIVRGEPIKDGKIVVCIEVKPRQSEGESAQSDS